MERAKIIGMDMAELDVIIPTREETQAQNKLRRTMVEQSGNTTNLVVLGLIEDYISFWLIEKRLDEDIRKRGVNIKWQNSPTSNGYKKNESIAEKVKVNAQKMKILDQIGIKTLPDIIESNDIFEL